MKQLGFVINLDKCLGCQTCEVACKQEKGVKVGMRWRRVAAILGERRGVPFAYFLSIACNHCENPACLQNCPAAAYKKTEEGVVLHNPDRCIGCRLCTMACPYGSPQYNEEEGKVEKCDLCLERLRAGLKPACVQSCPVGALEVEDMDSPPSPDATLSVRGFPDPSLTCPSVRFKLPRVPRSEVHNWDKPSEEKEEKI